MQASPEYISYLFKQHFTGRLTPEEQQDFFTLINAGEDDAALQQLMNNAWNEYIPNHEAPKEWSHSVLAGIIQEQRSEPIAPVPKVHFLQTVWLRYAAAVVIMLSAGGYFWWKQASDSIAPNSSSPTVDLAFADLPPGGNKAMLTLADGSTILLDSAANGDLATQGNARIIKLSSGQLAYLTNKADATLSDSSIDAAVTSKQPTTDLTGFNSITTPNGGQYQVALPDGSLAWLNAASSIRFPANFAKERNVSITGEVYFEVAPDKNKPFFVTVNDLKIQVLGTSFNVNAYADEPLIKTTLVEGRIAIGKGHPLYPLRAGQQARFTKVKADGDKSPDIYLANNANLEQVMAWKNGLFDFQNATLAEVMRQLARWYNINVQYENGIPNIEFEGKLGRDVSFSKMLVFFKEWGVDFRIENGNTLIITNKKL